MRPVRLEVRCCCNPDTVLGWLDVPEERTLPGTKLHLPVIETWPVKFGESVVDQITRETIVLEVGIVVSPQGRRRIAVKSNDTPIDILKRVPGFRLNSWI